VLKKFCTIGDGDGNADKNSWDVVGMGTQPAGMGWDGDAVKMGTGTAGTVGDVDRFYCLLIELRFKSSHAKTRL